MRISLSKQWFLKTWRQWRSTVFFIVFVILPVKSSLADFNWVPTGSMNPTILEGDYIFVNKAAYDLRVPFTLARLAAWSDPARGDIVICFSPLDGKRLVKRVVGLPGDTLSMSNNQLVINGEPLNQEPMSAQDFHGLTTTLRCYGRFAREDLGGRTHAIVTVPSMPAKRSFKPITIPEGAYFVMGDNRDNSLDSRMFGLIARRAIVGKAVGIAGSFNIKDKYQPRLGRFFSGLN
jgi:signal peptidase I